MAVDAKLKHFLTTQNISFTHRKHPAVYTAQEIAAAQHVSGKQLAKCVLIKTERGPHLAVLPAAQLIDLGKLKKVLKVKHLSIAREADIKAAFPDIETGAMSPFGNLYNVPTVVDARLAECPEITCNAGSHTDTFTLHYRDFERVAKPKVGSFALEVAARRTPSKRPTAAKPKRRTTPTKKRPTRRKK